MTDDVCGLRYRFGAAYSDPREKQRRASFMDRALTIFIQVWVALFVLANTLGIAGQFYLHGFADGFAYIQEIYSPFNIINYIFMVLTLLPAIGAYQWREKRRAEQATPAGNV